MTPIDYAGNLFVIAAPSGAGKSSLVGALLQVDSHLVVAVSHTTRAPRGQEQQVRIRFALRVPEVSNDLEPVAAGHYPIEHSKPRRFSSLQGCPCLVAIAGCDYVVSPSHQLAVDNVQRDRVVVRYQYSHARSSPRMRANASPS